MPLTQLSPLPTHIPEKAVPVDAAQAFALSAQTLTASGYVNSNQLQIDTGVGLMEARLAIELFALDLSSGDETYKLMLLGSNDPAFGNGNVDILATQDFAAASAGRGLPTIVPASDAVPTSGRYSSRFVVPFTNKRGIYLFRYLQLYALLGGTTPSISLTAWLGAF